MVDLFDPIQVGELQLPNRIFMSPLTRNRSALPGRVPTALMREYYIQRASAGLIISEAASVEPMGVGYPQTPGVWSAEQTDGWRSVVEGVHAAGGRIFLQLWHVGRLSDPSYLNGALPVGPSAIAKEGTVRLLRPKRAYPVPRALRSDEIPAIIESFSSAAKNAMSAGFDGVEIHGANGYLIDQFLQDSANRRTDSYGGPVENRARLLLEIVDAVVDVWGRGRVGVRLAPRGDGQIEPDSDPAGIFEYAAGELGRRRIAYLCTREAQSGHRFSAAMRTAFGGVFVANEGLTPDSSRAALRSGEADAVAFGKLFIANPDLPERLRNGWPLQEWDKTTFYYGEARGYTDYDRYAPLPGTPN